MVGLFRGVIQSRFSRADSAGVSATCPAPMSSSAGMASPAPSRAVAIPVLIVLLLATHVAAAFFLSRQGPPPARSSWRIAFYSDFDRGALGIGEAHRFGDNEIEQPEGILGRRADCIQRQQQLVQPFESIDLVHASRTMQHPFTRHYSCLR